MNIGSMKFHNFNLLQYEPVTFTEFIPGYKNRENNNNNVQNDENENKDINVFDVNNLFKSIFGNNTIEKKEDRIETTNRELQKENPDDKIISVNFVSMGFQDIINYSIPCKITDTFTKLEEKLLQDFPKLKDYEIFFEINAQRILRHKTLKENNIKENSVVSVFIVGDNN